MLSAAQVTHCKGVEMFVIDRCLPSSPLPGDFDDLRQDAVGEGYRFVERLHEERRAGTMRFEGQGEILLIATVAGACAGLGGLTADPTIAGLLRLRRFYVRPRFRGLGLGRQLAARLLAHARQYAPGVTVNAGTVEAGAFWEKMGLMPSVQAGITHRLDF